MRPFLDVFRSRRIVAMLPLGFAGGLPNPLVGSTLTAWMALEGVDLKTIGLFGLVGLPYSLKFVWAPLFDRFTLPLLGRRRGWMLASQLGIIGAVVLLGTASPSHSPGLLALLALAVAFFSATQDIVADAYRADVLAPNELASGAAVFVASYRVALIVSGAGCLILSDHLPWPWIYAGMAALMLVGVVGTLLAPDPEIVVPPPTRLRDAVIEPLREFVGREHALVALAVVLSYKIGDAIASHMLSPYLIQIGFTGTDIGGVQKGLGMAATVGGTLLGGALVPRMGLRRALLLFGFLQAVANVLYMLLLFTGRDHAMLVVAVGVDHLCTGLGTAAFLAYLMTLCDARFSAMQFALLSSAMNVGGRVLGVGGGYLADRFGWLVFFGVTILLALPALALLASRPIATARSRDETITSPAGEARATP